MEDFNKNPYFVLGKVYMSLVQMQIELDERIEDPRFNEEPEGSTLPVNQENYFKFLTQLRQDIIFCAEIIYEENKS